MGLFGMTVEPVLFLYCFVQTQTLTALPQLILQKLCLQQSLGEPCHFANKTIEDEVQKQASSWMIRIYLCSTVPSLVTILVIGLLAQRFGRKRLLMLIPIVNALQNAILVFSSVYLETSNALLLMGGLAVSLFGDVQGVVSLCFTHLAEVTQEDVRTWRMALLESCLFTSVLVAGVCSGYLISNVGFWSVFAVSLACDLVIFVYVAIVIKDITSSNSGISSNPFSFVRRTLKEVAGNGNQKIIYMLIIVYAFIVYGFWSELYIIPLYLKNGPFHATAETIGLLVSLPALLRGIGAVALTTISHKYFHFKDATLVCTGILSCLVSFLAFGMARNVTEMALFSLLSMFIPVTTAGLRSMLTKRVSTDHHGALISIILSVDVLSNIVANFTSLEIYKETLQFYTGIAFFVVATFDCLALLILLCVWRISKRGENYGQIA